MQIHRSTLRYRLARIRDITGRDLQNVDTRLNLHLATGYSTCSVEPIRPRTATGSSSRTPHWRKASATVSLSPRREARKRDQRPTGYGAWTRKNHIRRAVVHSRVEVRCVMPPAEFDQSDGAVGPPFSRDLRKGG
ncbi:MAG: helix-turn-helix domain-containing protein [Mycobacterium sp.]